MTKVTALKPVSNDGEDTIEASMPYTATITIEGVADILFHRWSCEGVEEKAKAAKGSKAKKSDNIESYVYRNDDGDICLPSEYLRGAIIGAAKFRQDPRSPRKSAMDLFKAGVVATSDLVSLGIKEWDYEHRCRVTIQRNAITRTRPAIKKGWRATCDMSVLLPEYIDRHLLNDVVTNAGKLIGVGDFRPTYGRFQIVEFKISQD